MSTSSVDWLHPEKSYPVVCRPALPKDTPDVMELTSTIWEGEDYVPFVWQKWLEDYDGLLAVAEYGGRVVGTGKLTHLSNRDWWLEGLRVHPQHEGRRIASQMHDYLLGYWLRSGNGTLRLATASFRLPVRHLCERSGFTKIGEFTPYEAPVLPGDNPVFSPIAAGDAAEALKFAMGSPTLKLLYGLMDLGWQWSVPRESFLAEAAAKQQAWWWQGRRGLLALGEDEEKDEKWPMVRLIACPFEDMVDLLQDYRRLAAGSGYQKAGWAAPLHPALAPVLSLAGFERAWDESIFLYAREHPERG